MGFRVTKHVEAPREHKVPGWKVAISILSLVAMSPIIGLVLTFMLVTFAPAIPLMAVLAVGFVVKRHAEADEPFGTPDPSGSLEPSLENPHAFGQLG